MMESESPAHLIHDLANSISSKPGPVYARLKQAIEAKISSGSWLPHQRLPSEAEFVVALEVSRMTVNRALRELTNAGVLTRQQGVGTFVAEQKVLSALFEVHNIADEIAARGHCHQSQVINLQQDRATHQEAVLLGLRTGHAIFRSTLLHLEDQLPIQLEERIVNGALVPDYGEQDFTQITPFTYLSQIAPLTEGEHLVEAVCPHTWEAQLLAIDQHEACLQIRRRTWSAEQLVSRARLLSPGSKFQLFGHFAR